jgi:hypothetical protein
MKLTRTDGLSLLAIGVGGLLSVTSFGPPRLDILQTTTTTTVVTTDWSQAPIVVTTRGFEAPAEPIVYVDGVLVDAVPVLTPDRIERVEFVKGGAAIEAFGAAGSAGVIQIFTKDGVAGDPRR